MIRGEIMQGQLRFGQKISENAYADRLNVSRTPVREAFLLLASLGLLTVRPRSGTYVVSFSKDSLQELFEVRLLLEQGGVRLATDEQRRRLVDELRCMMTDLTQDVSDSEAFDMFSRVDTAFHVALVAAAQNDRLLTMYRPIEICAQAARSRLPKSPAVAETANAHHAAIVEAIANGDIGRFETVLEDHLAWVVGMLMRVDELFSGPPS